MVPEMKAYATLITSDDYLPGTLVLGHKLRKLKAPEIKLIALLTPALSAASVDLLSEVYDELISVDAIESAMSQLSLLERPELAVTLTKIHLWSLTQFEAVCYVDSDVLPVKGLDLIFETDIDTSQVAAAPDSSWPDYFNSGVFLLKPSAKTYTELNLLTKDATASFDGADQGLLNEFFPTWVRVPFLYNVTPPAGVYTYEYLPAIVHNKNKVKAFHFIGHRKPWMSRSFADLGLNDSASEFFSEWWSEFDAHYVGDEAAKVFDTTVPTEKLASTPLGETGDETGGETGGEARGEAHDLKVEKQVNEWDKSEVSSYTPKELKFEVPTDMIPENKTSAKPTFPWEERRVKATRYFPEDV